MTATLTANKKPVKHKKLIIVLASILAFILILISAFLIFIKIGEVKLRNSLVANEGLINVDDFDESAVYHNGKSYYYNENLINILLIGIDRYEITDTGRGQADALYLVSVDTKLNQVKITGISRNTLCDIDVLSMSGESFGTEKKQICLSYAYGNDDDSSSKNTAKAVSNLLYGIPINGYYTLRMNTISRIVDSVGGVKLTVPSAAEGTLLEDRIGKTLTLNGDDALIYLLMRGDSNAPRVERHKEFITSFINSAKVAVKKDASLPIKTANKLSRETTTNIDVSSMVYLATEALNWKLDFVNIKGEYSMVDGLEIFTVDEKDLKQKIIDTFYTVKK